MGPKKAPAHRTKQGIIGVFTEILSFDRGDLIGGEESIALFTALVSDHKNHVALRHEEQVIGKRNLDFFAINHMDLSVCNPAVNWIGNNSF